MHNIVVQLSIFLVITILIACGKAEEPVVNQANPTDAPPPPAEEKVATASAPEPTLQELENQLNEFTFYRFNRVLDNCRPSLYRRAQLLSYLFQQLQVPANENESPFLSPGFPYNLESRGFHGGPQGQYCMGQLDSGMGDLRDLVYRGDYRPETMQNWLGHATNWAVNGVRYPNRWPNSGMPQGYYP